MAKGYVIQFRRGRKNYTPRHFLVEVEGVSSRKDALKFIGKIVLWKSVGKNSKIISGKVSAAHGNKGLLRVVFEKGLPGQAIGSEVEVN